MPKSTKHKLAYQKKYNARPEMVNRRELNNAARQELIREGKARVGDGKDVAHKTALDRSTKNANRKSNLVVQTRAKNRGWRKGGPDYNP